MKILIVGKNSFISKNIISVDEIDRVSFDDIENVNFSNYDAVLNCSIHPNTKTEKYNEKNDLDFIVAEKSHKNKCYYLMLSSRKVYGSSDVLIEYTEESDTNPNDFYGENKLITEDRIRNNFDNYCIMRCSNIYGMEIGRKSFLGFCLNQLKSDRRIVYEISGRTKRDFLPVEVLGDIIVKSCNKNLTGIYNVGSNYPLEIGKIASYLIEGYKSGYFQDGTEAKDQFVLNTDKLKKDLDIYINVNYSEQIKKIGELLLWMTS